MLQWIFEKFINYSITHDKINLFIFLCNHFNKSTNIWEKKIRNKIDIINQLNILFPEYYL